MPSVTPFMFLLLLFSCFIRTVCQQCIYSAAKLTKAQVGLCISPAVDELAAKALKTYQKCELEEPTDFSNPLTPTCAKRALIQFGIQCAAQYGPVCAAWVGLSGGLPPDMFGCDGVHHITVEGIPLARWKELNIHGGCPFTFVDPAAATSGPSPAKNASASISNAPGTSLGSTANNAVHPRRSCYDVRLAPSCSIFAHDVHTWQPVLCANTVCATKNHLVYISKNTQKRIMTMGEACASLNCTRKEMSVNTCLYPPLSPQTSVGEDQILSLSQFDNDTYITSQTFLNNVRIGSVLTLRTTRTFASFLNAFILRSNILPLRFTFWNS